MRRRGGNRRVQTSETGGRQPENCGSHCTTPTLEQRVPNRMSEFSQLAALYARHCKPLGISRREGTAPRLYPPFVDGFQPSCDNLGIRCSCIDLCIPNYQDLSKRKAATGSQGSPVSRESLPAIINAMEGVRGLEGTIWDVYPFLRQFRS